MASPYSMDLRQRVIEAVEGGLSCNQAAARFEVAISTAIGWVNRYRETGSFAPDRMGGHRPKKLVCATGVAAAAVPGQGVHLARPSRRAGRAWPQRRLSCGLAVRS